MASNANRIKKPQNSLVRPLNAFIQRFHLLLFFVFIIACLSATIVLINQTFTATPDESYVPSNDTGTIDQTTLERIQTLHASTQPSEAPALPEGRVNPFTE